KCPFILTDIPSVLDGFFVVGIIFFIIRIFSIFILVIFIIRIFSIFILVIFYRNIIHIFYLKTKINVMIQVKGWYFILCMSIYNLTQFIHLNSIIVILIIFLF